VALAEQDYLFEVLQQSVPESDVRHGAGFEGLFALIEQMINEGYEPDVVLMPISYMLGFRIHHDDRIEWGSKRTCLESPAASPAAFEQGPIAKQVHGL
jgi:hypothetical protein